MKNINIPYLLVFWFLIVFLVAFVFCYDPYASTGRSSEAFMSYLGLSFLLGWF